MRRLGSAGMLSSAAVLGCELLGKTWKISPTNHKHVLIVHHPGSRFWVIPHTKKLSKWPSVLGSFSLKSPFSF
jgi:hypothetical protein